LGNHTFAHHTFCSFQKCDCAILLFVALFKSAIVRSHFFVALFKNVTKRAIPQSLFKKSDRTFSKRAIAQPCTVATVKKTRTKQGLNLKPIILNKNYEVTHLCPFHVFAAPKDRPFFRMRTMQGKVCGIGPRTFSLAPLKYLLKAINFFRMHRYLFVRHWPWYLSDGSAGANVLHYCLRMLRHLFMDTCLGTFVMATQEQLFRLQLFAHAQAFFCRLWPGNICDRHVDAIL